jgi:hypothetical protein
MGSAAGFIAMLAVGIALLLVCSTFGLLRVTVFAAMAIFALARGSPGGSVAFSASASRPFWALAAMPMPSPHSI